MTDLGYALISEEHGPDDLVDYAVRAEDAGFEYATISDHYHPWTSTQGESPFVWSTIGGIARETEEIRLGTAVTCPTVRIHPAIIAQAAATAGSMMPGRFFLGVGTGEALNEHVVGERWPPHHVRLDKLTEAIDVIRTLWEGGMHSHDGDHFTADTAQVHTLPDDLPPIVMSADGETSGRAAADYAEGIISTAPREGVADAYTENADDPGPRYGQLTVCWAETEAEAIETAHEQWPNTALTGELTQILPTPTHFEQACRMVGEDDVAEQIVAGDDADEYIDQIEQFADAGYDHVHVHQIGPDQEGFIEFAREELLPSY
jgi:G6PDH family F420-dependent oxidoreductase